jgi:hypothetical protein
MARNQCSENWLLMRRNAGFPSPGTVASHGAEYPVRDEMTNEGRIQAQVSFLYGTDRGMFKRVDGAATSGGDQFMKTGFEDNEPPTPVGGSGSKVTYYVSAGKWRNQASRHRGVC